MCDHICFYKRQKIYKCFQTPTCTKITQKTCIFKYCNLICTYKYLSEASTDLAKGFLDDGLLPGDTVGVWGPNHPEWILTEYALAKAGLKMVTLNPLYKEQELIFALNTVNAKGLIHADAIGGLKADELIEIIKPEITSLKNIHSFDTGLKKLISSGKQSLANLPSVNSKDIFMIQTFTLLHNFF